MTQQTNTPAVTVAPVAPSKASIANMFFAECYKMETPPRRCDIIRGAMKSVEDHGLTMSEACASTYLQVFRKKNNLITK